VPVAAVIIPLEQEEALLVPEDQCQVRMLTPNRR
jgi:hypothetical protein